MFAIRAVMVVPIVPSQDVWLMTYGMDRNVITPAMVEEFEGWFWISMWMWILILLTGSISGLLALRGRQAWRYVFLLGAAIYLLYVPPWSWFALHGRSLRSVFSLESHARFLLDHPGLTFTTLVFPIFVLALAVYVVARLIKERVNARSRVPASA